MLDDIEFDLNLIRHGQSEVNVDPDRMGQGADVPLTAKGKRQARALHNRFLLEGQYFDRIYSSDYTRAFDTAQIVKGDTSQPIIIYEDLREYSAGDWTDQSRKEVLTPEIKLRMGYLNMGFLPPNGESLNQVERRVSTWVEEAIMYNKEMIELAKWKKENNHPPINIACFTHGMTIKTFLHYIMGYDKSIAWKIVISNTSITRLHFGKEGWWVCSINDCAHLLPER